MSEGIFLAGGSAPVGQFVRGGFIDGYGDGPRIAILVTIRRCRGDAGRRRSRRFTITALTCRDLPSPGARAPARLMRRKIESVTSRFLPTSLFVTVLLPDKTAAPGLDYRQNGARIVPRAPTPRHKRHRPTVFSLFASAFRISN